MTDLASLPLNQGQQLAADGFLEFLLSDDKELNISGPGGVGKTFLLGHIIDNIIPQYQQACLLMGVTPKYEDVVMTATTNKAADVLALNTNRPAHTVHSYFNLKVQDDYSNGTSKVTKTKMWVVHSKKIIFIDEASMVDRVLYEYIQDGTLDCKVIYVGDRKQLAPVKEKISRVYSQNLPMFELTEPMRTDIPELQALNQQFRDTVGELGNPGPWLPIQTYPGIIEYLNDGEMEQSIIDNFTDMNHRHRIMAYTNAKVIDYNSYIRELRGLPDDIQKGEILINNSAVRIGKFGLMGVEEEVTVWDMNRTTEQVVIDEDDPDTTLEVRYMDLQSSHGEIYAGIPVPVDRDHYAKLLQFYANRKRWVPYFHMKNTFPDLRQRDACTVYKAQGSSYDWAYIDVGNLSTCRDPEQAARLFYVAVSRARFGVRLYGPLAEKFGSIVV